MCWLIDLQSGRSFVNRHPVSKLCRRETNACKTCLGTTGRTTRHAFTNEALAILWTECVVLLVRQDAQCTQKYVFYAFVSLISVRGTKFGGQSSGDKVRGTKFGGQSSGDKVRGTKFGGQSSGDKVRGTKFGGQSSGDKVRGTKFGGQSSGDKSVNFWTNLRIFRLVKNVVVILSMSKLYYL